MSIFLPDLTPIPVVDSHVHVFPDKLAQAVRNWFSRHAWEFYEQGSAQQLLQRLFHAGLHGAVLLSYAHRPGISEELNGFVASLAKRFPKAVGFATVHHQDKDVRGILRRAFQELNLQGVKLHCHVQLVAPDDPALDPVYETASDWGFPVTIHAGKEPYVPAYPMDVRTITGAERVKRVLKRFPELRLIVPHLGFGESGQFYRLLDAHPHLYLDTTMMLGGFFPVRVEKEPLVRYSERLLYGTDYPHIPYQMDRELRGLLALELGETPTRKILWENARDLLRLEAPM